MSDINLTADMSEAIEEIGKVNNLTAAAIQKLKDWAQATVQFNYVQENGIEVLKKTDLVIKGLISDTQELTAKLHDEGAGWEFVTSKVKEVNNSKAKLAEISRELAGINREAANQAKAFAQADAQRAQQQARSAQAESRSNRQEFQAKLTSQTATAVKQQVGNISPDDVNKVNTITNQIGKLGTAAGLSTQAVLKLYNQVKSGDIGNLDQKYAPLIDQLQKLNTLGNKPPPKFEPLPTPNLDKLSGYLNILTRIQSTLTNLALYRGFNILTNSLTSSVGEAQDLQIELSLIRTITQDSQQTVSQYGDAVKRVSAQTGYAAKDIATLFYDLASNQVAAGAAIESVALKATELARVTKASPQQAGNILAAIANTYGQEAGTLDEQTAKLFKLVDNGRVKLGELDQTFGKSLNTGKELGVSFDQLGASLSALTSTGLKTDESQTLLFNVMKALRNPTKEMSAALAEMNASSGAAAVKMYSLFGVFQRLQALSKAGKFDISQLLPDAREQRFFAAFTNDAEKFSRFEKDQANAGSSYKGAQEIRGESDADKIQKGLQVFKNAAISTFGDQVTKLVSQFVDLTSKTEDIEKKARSLFQTVATGVATIVTFRTSMTILGTILELNAARQARLALATNAATAAQLRSNTAARGAGIGATLGAINPYVATAAFVASGIVAYNTYEATAIKSYEETGRAYQQYVDGVKAAALDKELAKSSTETDKLREKLKEASKSLTATFGKALSENAKGIESIGEKLKVSGEELKAGFAGVATITSNSLKDTENAIGRIRSERERIIKDKTQNGLHATEGVGSVLNQFANPVQQIQLIDQEYANLQKRIDDLVKQGTVEALQEAEKLQSKQVDLINQYYTKEAQLRNEAFKEDYANKQRLGQLTGAPGENVFVFNPDKLYEAQNQQAQKQLNLQDLILKKLKEQEDVEVAKLAKQKTAQKAQQDAISAYEKFSVNDEQGNVKSDYLTNGKYDPNKAKNELDRLSKNVVKTTFTDDKQLGPQELAAKLSIQKQFEDNNKLKTEQAERVKIQQDLTKGQADAVELDKKAAAALDAKREATVKYNKDTGETISKLELLAKALAEGSRGAPDAIHQKGGINEAAVVGLSKLSNAVKETIGLGNSNEIPLGKYGDTERIRPVYEAVAKLAEQAKEELKTASSKLVDKNGQKVIDPVIINQSIANFKDVIDKLESTVRQQYKNEGNTADPKDFKLPGTNLSIRDIRNQLDNEQKDFRGISANGSNSLDTSKEAAAINQTADAAVRTAKTFDGLSGSVINFQKLIDQASGFSKTPPGPADNNQIAPPGFGDKGIQKSFGGLIDYKAYGGPIGQDKKAAWLTAGESVNTVASTQRFYSRIMQMNNQSRVPQYFNEGGVVTNMGGVKFHINGAQSPKATAREVHNMLRRARRTGSI